MALFAYKEGNLNYINEVPFKLEKDIQTICEKNMHTLLSYVFIKSEFLIDNFRIDSLAYDSNSNAFVIIEYKRDKNFSVIDQGYAYLALMLNHKSDFILEYNETTGNNLKRNDVDWTQSKVIFISPSFTSYQKEAIGFKDLPIELWEIKGYSNTTVSFTQILTKGAVESIKTITKSDEKIADVNKEIKVYSEYDLLDYGSEEIRELYEKLKTMILNIGDDIKVKPTKTYIAFIRKSNICDISVQKSSLKLWLNASWGDVDDSQKITRDVTKIGHHGNGAYEIIIYDDSKIEYVVSLVRQVYIRSISRNGT